jgi:hypothetical protein
MISVRYMELDLEFINISAVAADKAMAADAARNGVADNAAPPSQGSQHRPGGRSPMEPAIGPSVLFSVPKLRHGPKLGL